MLAGLVALLDEPQRATCLAHLQAAGAASEEALCEAAQVSDAALAAAQRSLRAEEAWRRLSGLAPGARVPSGWTPIRVADALARDPATHHALFEGMRRLWHGPPSWSGEPIEFRLASPHFKDLRVCLRDEPGAYAGLVETMLGLARPIPVAPVRTIYDLGAHIGLMALCLHARHPGASLVCVEPSPANVALLRDNLRRNGVNARVIQAAMSTHDGHSLLHEHPFSSLLHGTSVGPGFGHQGTKVVPTLALSSLLESGDEPFAVKLDIEGAEHGLIANPGRLFDATWIMGELHHGDVGPPRSGLLALLRHRYRVELASSRFTVGDEFRLRIAQDFVATNPQATLIS